MGGKRIEVRVSDIDIISVRGESEPMILARLKAAGIPVKGTFLFAGVNSGILKQFRENNSTVFVWNEE